MDEQGAASVNTDDLDAALYAELLMVDERGRGVWKQTIRRAGVPEKYRSRFWRYLMYNVVPWLPVSESTLSSPQEGQAMSHARSSVEVLSHALLTKCRVVCDGARRRTRRELPPRTCGVVAMRCGIKRWWREL